MCPANDDDRSADAPDGSWQIRLTETGGAITHLRAPRFEALWTTGFEDLPEVEGLLWTEEGLDEDEAITLYDFRWQDPAPDQARFETLMGEAITALDAWIARRL
jgi:hypothetical protein